MAIFIFFPLTNEEFAIDATSSITPDRSADVTRKRVEDGGNISDNRNRQPLTLSLNGFFSNIPNEDTVYQHDAEGNHTQFRDRILKAEADSEFITIDAGIPRELYENMLITSLSFPWDTSVGTGLPFSMTLQQVRIVRAQVKNLFKQTEEFKAAQAKFSQGIDVGRQALKAATGNVATAATNAATSASGLTLFDWFRGN